MCLVSVLHLQYYHVCVGAYLNVVIVLFWIFVYIN